MSTLTREQVFDQLAALGLASVRMSFYGGHDEGDGESDPDEIEGDEDGEVYDDLAA